MTQSEDTGPTRSELEWYYYTQGGGSPHRYAEHCLMDCGRKTRAPSKICSRCKKTSLKSFTLKKLQTMTEAFGLRKPSTKKVAIKRIKGWLKEQPTIRPATEVKGLLKTGIPDGQITENDIVISLADAEYVYAFHRADDRRASQYMAFIVIYHNNGTFTFYLTDMDQHFSMEYPAVMEGVTTEQYVVEQNNMEFTPRLPEPEMSGDIISYGPFGTTRDGVYTPTPITEDLKRMGVDIYLQNPLTGEQLQFFTVYFTEIMDLHGSINIDVSATVIGADGGKYELWPQSVVWDAEAKIVSGKKKGKVISLIGSDPRLRKLTKDKDITPEEAATRLEISAEPNYNYNIGPYDGQEEQTPREFGVGPLELEEAEYYDTHCPNCKGVLTAYWWDEVDNEEHGDWIVEEAGRAKFERWIEVKCPHCSKYMKVVDYDFGYDDMFAESFEEGYNEMSEYYVHSPDEYYGPYYSLQEGEDARDRLEAKGIEVLGITLGKSGEWMDAESYSAEGKKKKSGCMHYKYGKHKWAYTPNGKICIDCGNQGVRSRWGDVSKWKDAETEEQITKCPDCGSRVQYKQGWIECPNGECEWIDADYQWSGAEHIWEPDQNARMCPRCHEQSLYTVMRTFDVCANQPLCNYDENAYDSKYPEGFGAETKVEAIQECLFCPESEGLVEIDIEGYPEYICEYCLDPTNWAEDESWEAENWGGDPDGILAKALAKARDKMKERKSLNITKLPDPKQKTLDEFNGAVVWKEPKGIVEKVMVREMAMQQLALSEAILELEQYIRLGMISEEEAFRKIVAMSQ